MPFQPRFTITPRIQRQMVAIERTRGFLKAVRLHDEWIAKLRSETQVEDALASVQIEGNSLTLERAFELVSSDAGGLAAAITDSEREFLNYLSAFEAVDGLRNESEAVLTKGDLLNLHRLIVDGVRGGQRSVGQIRRESVAVGDVIDGEQTVHHQPPPWTDVDDHLRDLMEWIELGKEKGSRKNVEDTWLHPAVIAGITQHRLAWIHPFLDGNGRTARMFTTLILFQRGYDFKYLFNLSHYYNRDRDKYYDALRTADREDDYTQWLEYFLGGFSHQLIRIEEQSKKYAAGLVT